MTFLKRSRCLPSKNGQARDRFLLEYNGPLAQTLGDCCKMPHQQTGDHCCGAALIKSSVSGNITDKTDCREQKCPGTGLRAPIPQVRERSEAHDNTAVSHRRHDLRSLQQRGGARDAQAGRGGAQRRKSDHRPDDHHLRRGPGEPGTDSGPGVQSGIFGQSCGGSGRAGVQGPGRGDARGKSWTR